MVSPPGAPQLSLRGVIIIIEPGCGKSTLVWIGSEELKPFGPLSAPRWSLLASHVGYQGLIPLVHTELNKSVLKAVA